MKKTIRIAVSLALVLVLALSLAGCGQKAPYTSVLDNLSKAMEGDSDAMLAIFPPEYAEIFELMGMDMNDLTDEISDSDIKGVKWKIVSDEALSQDHMDELNESRMMYKEMLDVDVSEATEGYAVEAVFTYEDEEEPLNLDVLCIDGKWYVDPDHFDY